MTQTNSKLTMLKLTNVYKRDPQRKCGYWIGYVVLFRVGVSKSFSLWISAILTCTSLFSVPPIGDHCHSSTVEPVSVSLAAGTGAGAETGRRWHDTWPGTRVIIPTRVKRVSARYHCHKVVHFYRHVDRVFIVILGNVHQCQLELTARSFFTIYDWVASFIIIIMLQPVLRDSCTPLDVIPDNNDLKGSTFYISATVIQNVSLK